MKITLTYGNTPYTLEFTRRTVRDMEKLGFKLKSLSFDETPLCAMYDLFAGAFLANHRMVKRSTIEEIFDAQNDKMGLISALTEMYADTYQSMSDNGANTENPTWTAV